MTPAAHEALDRALRGRIRDPLKVIRSLIEDAISDASAHASDILSEDDRPWRPPVTGMHEMKMAERCLRKMGHDLVRLIKECRVACYHDSHGMHKPHLDPDFHIMDTEPSHECALACREAMIHGHAIGTQVDASITQAVLSLQRAVSASAASQSATLRQDLLRAWKGDEIDRLTGKAMGWLLDSSRAIHHAVGYSLIRPELRPEIA